MFDEIWVLFVCMFDLVLMCLAWTVHKLGRLFAYLFGGLMAVNRWDENFDFD